LIIGVHDLKIRGDCVKNLVPKENGLNIV